MIVTVNAVELASELADIATKDELIWNLKHNGVESNYSDEEDLFQEDENGDIRYKDEVQDVVNRYYDFYFSIITNLAHIK